MTKLYWPDIGPLVGCQNQKCGDYRILATCDRKDVRWAYLVVWDDQKQSRGFIQQLSDSVSRGKGFFTSLWHIRVKNSDYQRLQYTIFYTECEINDETERQMVIEKVRRRYADQIFSIQLHNRWKNADTLVFGSCHYTLWLGNKNIYSGENIFKAIMAQNPDFVLFLGDQIYSDNLKSFFQTVTLNEYKDFYKKQFGLKYLQRLMRSRPIYTIFDDHEFFNDFSDDLVSIGQAGGSGTGSIKHVNDAMRAYKLFQGMQNPDPVGGKRRMGGTLTFGDDWTVLNDNPNYYTFSREFADFFVMDLRMERTPGHQIYREQLQALLRWLAACDNNRIKFVVSSVPLFPAHVPPKDDWMGYSHDALHIFNFIELCRINNVYILCGDSHYSLVSTLRKCGYDYIEEVDDTDFSVKSFIAEEGIACKTSDSNDEYEFKITSICSSPFQCFKLGKFAVPSDWRQMIPRNHYAHGATSYFYVDNEGDKLHRDLIHQINFCKLTMELGNLTVQYFDDHNELIRGWNFEIDS